MIKRGSWVRFNIGAGAEEWIGKIIRQPRDVEMWSGLYTRPDLKGQEFWHYWSLKKEWLTEIPETESILLELKYGNKVFSR